MTVLSFRDGVLAADSRTVDQFGVIVGSATRKIFRLSDGWFVAICGSDALTVPLLGQLAGKARLNSNAPRIVADLSEYIAEGDETVDASAIAWNPTKGYLLAIEAAKAGQVTSWPICDEFYALGSGRDIAIGAMDHGASAEQAVRSAARNHSQCGYPVLSVRWLRSAAVVHLDGEPVGDGVVPSL